MGFPFSEASWDVVTGPMYMGAGSSFPAIFTWISVALCVWALWAGNRKEHSLYSDHK